MKDVTIKIEISQSAPGGEEEVFELTTDGEYSHESGVSVFSYTEGVFTGYVGRQTTFTVNPECVVLHRSEGNAEMVFSEKEKHHFFQETEHGFLTMGIDTGRIRQKLGDDGGALEIDYTVAVDSITVSRNSFRIDIRV